MYFSSENVKVIYVINTDTVAKQLPRKSVAFRRNVFENWVKNVLNGLKTAENWVIWANHGILSIK